MTPLKIIKSALERELQLAHIDRKGREREYALARQVFYKLAISLTGHSMAEIGKAMGDRTHSTVSHAYRAWHNTTVKDNPPLAVAYYRLRQRLEPVLKPVKKNFDRWEIYNLLEEIPDEAYPEIMEFIQKIAERKDREAGNALKKVI